MGHVGLRPDVLPITIAHCEFSSLARRDRGHHVVLDDPKPQSVQHSLRVGSANSSHGDSNLQTSTRRQRHRTASPVATSRSTGASDLNAVCRQDVLVPICEHRRPANTATQGPYHILGFAVFHVTGYSFNGNTAAARLGKRLRRGSLSGADEQRCNKPCIRGCFIGFSHPAGPSSLASHARTSMLACLPHLRSPTNTNSNRPERTPLIMNRRRVIGATAAVALAGVGAAGLVSWANSTKASAEAARRRPPSSSWTSTCPRAPTLPPSWPAPTRAPSSRRPSLPGALTSDAQIGNQVAAADLYPGDQLVKARLAARRTRASPPTR